MTELEELKAKNEEMRACLREVQRLDFEDQIELPDALAGRIDTAVGPLDEDDEEIDEDEFDDEDDLDEEDDE